MRVVCRPFAQSGRDRGRCRGAARQARRCRMANMHAMHAWFASRRGDEKAIAKRRAVDRCGWRTCGEQPIYLYYPSPLLSSSTLIIISIVSSKNTHMTAAMISAGAASHSRRPQSSSPSYLPLLSLRADSTQHLMARRLPCPKRQLLSPAFDSMTSPSTLHLESPLTTGPWTCRNIRHHSNPEFSAPPYTLPEIR